MHSFIQEIICINKEQIFGPARFKDTLLSTFDVKKDLNEAESWIHKTRLMPLSGHKPWSLGYNIFYDLSHFI